MHLSQLQPTKLGPDHKLPTTLHLTTLHLTTLHLTTLHFTTLHLLSIGMMVHTVHGAQC